MFALLSLGSQGAYAENAERLARMHFRRGETYFATGRFSEALKEYQAAYELRPLPGFLFNIGQCYRNLGKLDLAVVAFKRYLRLKPDAPNRAAVEDLIADLERQIEAQRAVSPPELQPRPAPLPAASIPTAVTPRPRPVYKRWWFWTGAAAVVASAATGIYFLVRPTTAGPPKTTLGNIDFR